MVRVDEEGFPVTYEARGLIENQMYEFWVSASTAVGEGEPTPVVAEATNTRGMFLVFVFNNKIQNYFHKTIYSINVTTLNWYPTYQLSVSFDTIFKIKHRIM